MHKIRIPDATCITFNTVINSIGMAILYVNNHVLKFPVLMAFSVLEILFAINTFASDNFFHLSKSSCCEVLLSK